MDAADALLSARLCAGDDRALAEIFDQFGPLVYRAALRVLGRSASAQDVVQDVFVELWSHPDRFNPAAGTLRTYLMVLARYRALDLIRSELRRIARQERHYRLMPSVPERSPAEELDTTVTVDAVRAAVNLLPAGQRRVIELAYFEGMTCHEIALAAGIPEGTAKSRLRLAMAKLSNVLDPQLLESS